MVILQGCIYKIEEAIEFVQTNGLKSTKVQQMASELQNKMLVKVKYALCKSLAKHLSNKTQQQKPANADASNQIEEKQASNDKSKKSVQFDNVFDLVFNSNSMNPK